MIQLSHGLFRSNNVPDPDGPTSLVGGTDAGGTVRDEDNEASGVVVREVDLVGRLSSSSFSGSMAVGEALA
jgi:hypothetical protein